MTEPDPDRRRRWRWIPLAGIGTLVGVVIVVGVLFARRERPDPKSVEEAVEEFGTTTIPSTSAAVTVERPGEGVYVLEGGGSEAISFPPVDQADGATMPASVRHTADGCFTYRIDYNEAHWQDWRLCPDGDALVERGGRTFQRWDFGVTTVENLADFVCEPPVPFAVRDEGSEDLARRCVGTNAQVAEPTVSMGSAVVVGVESIEIGDEMLDAVHLRHDATFSGGQTGVSHTEFWLSVTDWMPLRGERDVRVESESPLGTVTYTESGWWQLTSTDPEV